MKILIWCEFPEQVNWKKVPKGLDIYVAAKSMKEYLKYKKYCSGVWPILSKGEGYWFSGYCSKEAIAKLKEFDGENIKIDIEPKISKLYRTSFIGKLLYPFILLSLGIPRKNQYLKKTIENLRSKTVIISGPALPDFILRLYGDKIKLKPTWSRNYFLYPTLFGRFWLIRKYEEWFIKKKIRELKTQVMFSLGCTGKGIIGDEKTYKTLEEFKRDVSWLQNLGVKNPVIFSLEGIMQRKDSKNWFKFILDCVGL